MLKGVGGRNCPLVVPAPPHATYDHVPSALSRHLTLVKHPTMLSIRALSGLPNGRLWAPSESLTLSPSRGGDDDDDTVTLGEAAAEDVTGGEAAAVDVLGAAAAGPASPLSRAAWWKRCQCMGWRDVRMEYMGYTMGLIDPGHGGFTARMFPHPLVLG